MPQLQPLSTVDRVAHLLKVDLPADDGAAVAALGWASDLVRTYTGQTITRVENDVVLLTPAAGAVELPQRPVISVSLVETVSIYDPALWTVLAPADYRLDTGRSLIRPMTYAAYWPASWPAHEESFRITYTHGLEDIPEGVAGATASIAARIMTMPPGILNERNGQRGATFRAEEFLTPMERWTLGNYRDARVA